MLELIIIIIKIKFFYYMDKDGMVIIDLRGFIIIDLRIIFILRFKYKVIIVKMIGLDLGDNSIVIDLGK